MDGEARDELHGLAKVLWSQVRALPYAHSDATGIPVVTTGQEQSHLGPMFFFGWGKLAAFRYANDKTGPSLVRLHDTFKGTLGLDASSAHNLGLESGNIRWAGGNPHGLRKFREAVQSDPVLVQPGLRRREDAAPFLLDALPPSQ